MKPHTLQAKRTCVIYMSVSTTQLNMISSFPVIVYYCDIVKSIENVNTIQPGIVEKISVSVPVILSLDC